MATEQIQEKLSRLFLPYAMERLDQIRENGTRFAYYTSASTAMKIVEKNRVWLRNANVMNDFSEVKHGQDCLIASWHDEKVGGRLRALLDHIGVGLKERVEKAFDFRVNDRMLQSYLLSISEHGSGTIDEDKHGRLSMWRAYGGKTNVAIILNNKPFLADSDALKVYASPVLYCNSEQFKKHFTSLIDGLESNLTLLKEAGPELVFTNLNWALHFSALSTKHPGFAEEREWRIIYSPTMWNSEEIEFDIEILEGVPQKVYKLKLMNYADQGLVGATIPELLEEILIGPTQFPYTIYDALVAKLREFKVLNAESKVRVSGIPLRR